MAKNANPVIHELAVLLASQSEGRLHPSKIQAFYANYLVAVKTLTELDEDDVFKAKSLSPPRRRLRNTV